MRNSFKALFWMLVGGGLAHVVHYLIYTNFLAQLDTVFNTQFAVTVETLLPSLAAAAKSAIAIAPLLAAVGLAAAGAVVVIKYKRDESACTQIANAERVYQDAAKELDFLKQMAIDLKADYQKKTETLRSDSDAKENEMARSFQHKASQFSEEIKKLKAEQAEANHTISKLISAQKALQDP